MKSYTDLEQSKKLAEILPIESADAKYGYIAPYEYSDRMYDEGYDGIPYPIAFIKQDYSNFFVEEYDGELPCWSLVALLNVLPVSCDDEQHCLALINHNPNEKTEWLCAYEDDKGNLMMECYADNQIDACVAMIEKLHEQNLL